MEPVDALPMFDNPKKRWVQTPSYRAIALHRVRSMKNEDWEADGYVPIGGPGETVCGIKARLHMPGVFSRMGAPRCRKCCKMIGIPPGAGIPFNNSEKNLTPEQQEA